MVRILKILSGILVIQVTNVFPQQKRNIPTENMNGKYLIANPNTGARNSFSTLYSTYPNVEYFEIYTPPISTRYAEVYWTMMDPLPLDDALVARFKDKTMAIVGYEADQVMKTNEGDKSVPITWIYPHHFDAYLTGSYSEMTQVDSSAFGSISDGKNNHGAKTLWMTLPKEDVEDPRPESHVPASQFVSDGSGGEFRKSFHGYPSGTAQLIDSPTTFHIQAMFVDTKNRHYNGTDFVPGVLPKASAAPPNAFYSGLVECPCTDRIHKDIEVTYDAQNTGTCKTPVGHPTDCFKAAKKVDPTISNAKQTTVDSEKYPSGCSLVHYKNGSAEILYNTFTDGPDCGVTENQGLGYANSTCICNTGIKGSIIGIPFSKECFEEPYADLVQQKNPTCWVDTYQGGLSCAQHKTVLLDTNQTQPEGVLTYHLKYRFYFQPYEPETSSNPPSHQNLIRFYYETEAWAVEYDVPKADPGTPPEATIHAITARWRVMDMIHQCDIRKNSQCSGNITNYDGIQLFVAAGHCHAPSCISMELYNADTGKLLCRTVPVYGQSDKVFDERDYIHIPPCLWGSAEEGLIPPTFLSFHTNLLSVKKNNNTNLHYGEMAAWKMRGVLVKKDA